MGFISTKAHTVIGLVTGALLVVSPVLFGFSDNQAASLVPIIVGVFIVLNELITTSPLSPIKLVPMKVHIVLDVVTGLFLLISPWLFSFMDNAEPSQWLPHVVVGLLVAGYALLTTTRDESSERIVS